jgi:hypothetical protein|tara:strand:- start:2223 stop:2684 length:462 start_codon:yes stop_codon:yes gene_type:complete
MTPKQKMFAELIADENPPVLIKAYEKAGYLVEKTASGATKNSTYVKASKLASTETIKRLAQSIRDKREKLKTRHLKRSLDKEDQLKSEIVQELRDIAFDKEEPAPNRAKALQLLGQTIGLYTEKVITKDETVSEKQLEQELKDDLAKWGFSVN